jgi:hypothetical protein
MGVGGGSAGRWQQESFEPGRKPDKTTMFGFIVENAAPLFKCYF